MGDAGEGVNRRNLEAYARSADLYAGDAPAEEDPQMRRACRELFTSRLPGPRVLEVGCGPGVDSKFFLDAGLRVLATDFCPRFIEIVRARFPALEARTMDMTDPDLPPASFDGIYAFASFLHLPRASAPATLAKLRALLAPGGVLFLALIASSKLAEYVIPDWAGLKDNPVLFTCYAEEEMDALLRAAGFVQREFFRITSPCYERMPRLVERGVRGYQVAARNAPAPGGGLL